MSPPIFDGSSAASPTGSPPPTGTDRPESHPPETVNVKVGVVRPDLDAVNGDGVKHCSKFQYRPDCGCRHCTGRCYCEPLWTEAERVAFLRRVQQEGQR